uniref:Uncharacterized protein n=1 Tax=Gibberella zeae TaxID=5518 RepID=A0A4E9EIW3_GIBZA
MTLDTLFEKYVIDFPDDGNPERQRIKESLQYFHREAMNRSHTYYNIVHCVLGLGNIDVYIRDQLENGSRQVSRRLDPRSGEYYTRIEIPHRAVRTQVHMASEGIINVLAISHLIDSIRGVFRSIALERPSEAGWRHGTEEDTVNIVEDVLKASSMDMVSRVCEEIREHRVLLAMKP